jgi:hypothetical protein
MTITINSSGFNIYTDDDGKHHREDGPAYESDMSMQWIIHGKLHREDGPALVWKYKVRPPFLTSKMSEWWYHGKKLDCKTNDEFLHLMKMKAFW